MPSVEGRDDDVPPKHYGVYGFSSEDVGIFGDSPSGRGVYGISDNTYGVYGRSVNGAGVYGRCDYDVGVYGRSELGYGVYGHSSSSYYPGVYGLSDNRTGVEGYSRGGGYGVYGHSDMGYGVVGETEGSDVAAVAGFSRSSPGVHGQSGTGYGVDAYSQSSPGVHASSGTGYGLYASSGVGLAALLDGNVEITGNLTIDGTLQKGGGRFKIDHPLDPANKYLSHSFVESPDMKNVYDGVVVLDDKGEAEIELPDWFGALNKNFRYQLTAIGAPGPNLHISEEIPDTTTSDYSHTRNKNKNNSRFKIAGGTPGMKVSWQVTGIRKDPWANAHRIPVEEDKPDKERGYYIYPKLYGQPEERGISRLLVPEIEKELPLINK